MPDLWPDEIATEGIIPPLTILREQAQHLKKKTKGLIEGVVNTHKTSDKDKTIFAHGFYLSVPALDNYSYLLIIVNHDVGLYPVDVVFQPVVNGVKCEHPEAFMNALKLFFSHEATLKILSSLLAQAQETEKGT
jgi:hypothetical protein